VTISSSFKKLTTGIAGLDRLIGEITAPYTMLIAGYPGTGKTTLAATICSENAAKGDKCLYISFYEDKEKHYRYMKRLGLNLEALESKGVYRFIRLPTMMNIDQLVEEITRLISGGYSVLVVDSISVLLEPVAGNPEKRAWLLNFFYQLPVVMNGLLILIAELPYGEETITPYSIEFIVDASILLKQRIEDGFITRLIEIRKARGVSIEAAETVFSISEDLGVVVHTPPILREIPSEGEEIELVCKHLMETVNRYHRGFTINVFYSPGSPPGAEDLLGILAMAVENDLKVLVISYSHPPPVLVNNITYFFRNSALSDQEIKNVLNRYMTITALNPFGQSLPMLAARELEIIELVKPDVVVFHGVHISRSTTRDYVKYFKELYNQLLYLKSRGITVFRTGICINNYHCDAETSIADVTYRFNRVVKESGEVDVKIIVYKRFRDPAILPGEILKECVSEWVDAIKNKLVRS
jgi:circadian clock protein KaiC